MTLTVAGQSEAIERLVALSKFATGAAAAKLVDEALSTTSLFVFSELKELSNIVALKDDPGHQDVYQLLEVFSVKTLETYRELEQSLPVLNEAQLKKLKQLTLVELAYKNKLLPYSVLLTKLEMSNVRDLENLIIESIFAGIIVGKLNQQAQSFEVQKAMARDFLPELYPSLLSSLKIWKNSCDTIVSNIDKQKEFLLQDHTKKQQAFNTFSDDLEQSHLKLSTAGKQNQNPSVGINRGKKRPNWE